MSATNSEDKLLNIDFAGKFSDQITKLYLSEDYSDVTFIVENQRLPAHRNILAARSEYFRALFGGGLLESSQKEIRLEVPLEAFKAVLRFIYSGKMCLSERKLEEVLDILGLADQYGFIELKLPISKFLNVLHSSICLNNVWDIFEAARLYDLDLTKSCYTFIDRNASDILAHESFNRLSQKSLEEILCRDSFLVEEFKIFLAVCEWCKHNPDVDANAVVSYVRLPLINFDEHLDEIKQRGILDQGRILDAIEKRASLKKLPYRVWPEVNIAAQEFGTKVIQSSVCWSQNYSNSKYEYPFDVEPFASGPQSASCEDFILELGVTSIINHIQIFLWKHDIPYSYIAEVSENKKQWDRIADYSDCDCRSRQSLYFPPKSVKYIKLIRVGKKDLTICALKAMYREIIPTLVNDLVAATVELYAETSYEGRKKKKSIFARTTACSRRIDLGQPYYIRSIHVLLSRHYSHSFYQIKVSTNNYNWSNIVASVVPEYEKPFHEEFWHEFSFPPRPVVYIKLTSNDGLESKIHHELHFDNEI